MNHSFFSPPRRVLIVGLHEPEQASAISAHLRRHELEPYGLPDRPPDSPEEFRELTRNAVFVLLDLDQSAHSSIWQNALRARRPTLPILALFEQANLEDLLPAGTEGLDGALLIPVHDEAFDQFIAPWVPATLMPYRGSLKGASDRPSFPPRAVEPSLSACHLSPASPANQTLLRQLAEHPVATRFIVQGPPGAEFQLVALELAALRGIDEPSIRFSPFTVAPGHWFLVTSDPVEFRESQAPLAMLIYHEQLPEFCSENISLTLTPLHRRPQDVAYYTMRWLPLIAAATHRAAFDIPIPLTWTQALLTCAWPGEFDQFWRTLGRLALMSKNTLFPPPLDPFTNHSGFEHALTVASVRDYRARLASMIPEELLPAVLTALGCPELPYPYA
ncbi:MAG: hypothetical protein RIQ79_1813 [Verrucomicrobiota bacterium]